MRFPTRNIRHAGYFLLTLGAVFTLVLLPLSPGNSQVSSPQSLASFNGKIAFMSDNFIYTVNPDGSGELELSTDGINLSPAWSPDGTRIAMSRRSPSETTGFFIYVMNANGSGLQKINTGGSGETSPTWSPDGSKIAFCSNRDGNQEIYVTNADGSNPLRLTNTVGRDDLPEWSPDGTRIAFMSTRDFPPSSAAEPTEIYVMNADGSNQLRLTNNTFSDSNPTWSADSSKIAFDTNRDGNFEIYKMNPDGSSQVNLSNHPSSDFDPAWSPDGTRIAFLSFRDSVMSIPQEIYAMNADGSNTTRVTNSFRSEVTPAWQPLSTAPSPTPTPSATPTPTPTPSPLLVISQVYAGGGTPGATYQGSFVELFNRGTTNVDLTHWSLRFASTATGTFETGVTFVSSGGIPIQPGQYVLMQIGSSGASGNPVFADFQAPSITLGLSGKIALVKPNGSITTAPCPLPDSDVADFVGYGSAANCFEGAGPTANLSNTTAAVRKFDGCLDTNNNSSDFPVNAPTPRNSGSPLHVCSNPIDDADFFVRQHYADFLNRPPDVDGLAFWTNQITSCGTDQTCIEIKRINVSAAFFLSIEFQETGYLVYRTYKAAYGNLPNAPVPLKLDEFLPDTQMIGQGVVVNAPGWEQQLENNKIAFFLDFVSRLRFSNAYLSSTSPAQFVDALFTKAAVTPSASERSAAISEFGSATDTSDMAARARALRRVAENATLGAQEKNRAFVLMQYFGYLRRNPNDPPEATLDFAGYNFWLTKLNQFNGNFVNADMVKAFITSGEYRQRF